MSIVEPYLTYAKLGLAAAVLAVVAGASYHFGGMASKTELAGFRAEQAENTATAVLAERASAAASRAADHVTETEHANTIFHIDSTPALSTPVFVFDKSPSAPVCPLPGAEGEAGSLAADPAGGRSQPVDRGRDIRPDVEALKRRLEKVMADYRQLDAEWQK